MKTKAEMLSWFHCCWLVTWISEGFCWWLWM